MDLAIEYSLDVFTSAQVFLLLHSDYKICTCSCTGGKKQVPFSMTIGNEELAHEFSQTLANGNSM